MSNNDYLFTSESVSEGHPDKLCDRISDAVLDAFIGEEPEARVAAETFATTNRVIVGGEVGLTDRVKLAEYMNKIEDIVRACVKDIGYEQEKFHWQTLEVTNLLHEQSAHIAQGVNASEKDGKDEGAGDQGLMFGYAIDETPELMPAPIHYSHAILRRLAEVRKNGTEPTLGPDAKSQLTLRYRDGKPRGITSVVLSTQHLDPSMTSSDVREIVEPYIRETVPEDWITNETRWWVNPTGKFVIGGPDGDAGLTGRKIIVDTYGGYARHGGGAFSGKDPSKVDRSAAYMARYIAKNIVASKLAKRCEVQLAYSIGVADPISVYVDTFGTGKANDYQLNEAIKKVFPLKPNEIISHLDLKRPIYTLLSAYGHFGRTGYSWEKIDMVEKLLSTIKL